MYAKDRTDFGLSLCMTRTSLFLLYGDSNYGVLRRYGSTNATMIIYQVKDPKCFNKLYDFHKQMLLSDVPLKWSCLVLFLFILDSKGFMYAGLIHVCFGPIHLFFYEKFLYVSIFFQLFYLGYLINFLPC